MQPYDLQKMQELLHDFYNLTKIKICIYDNAENELCYYPEKLTDFCRCLRADEVMDAPRLYVPRRTAGMFFAHSVQRQYHRLYRDRADQSERTRRFFHHSHALSRTKTRRTARKFQPTSLRGHGQDQFRHPYPRCLRGIRISQKPDQRGGKQDRRHDRRIYQRASCGRSVRTGALFPLSDIPIGNVFDFQGIFQFIRSRFRKKPQAQPSLRAASGNRTARQ